MKNIHKESPLKKIEKENLENQTIIEHSATTPMLKQENGPVG